MIQRLRNSDRLVSITLGCVALLAGLGMYGASVHAQAAKPNPEQQLNQLRQQIALLEHRVTELEKTKAGGVMRNDTSAEAKAPEGKKAGGQEKPSPLMTTVRAPFVVQDERGKTIFKVDMVPGDNRAIVEIGDSKGARVHLGPNAGGGSTIALYDSSNTPGIYVVNLPGKSFVSVVKGERASTILADDKSSSAIVYNAAGIPTGTMQAGETGAGRLKISNASGEVRIDVGITADDVGWVKADGPGGGALSTTPGVAHSWIRGLKK